MTKTKRIIVLSITLFIGIILGGAGASYCLFEAYDNVITKLIRAYTRRDIVRPYVTLSLLRKNDTATVIEMQEDKLETGLFSFASEEKQDWTDDDRLMLKKIRAYRAKYPRKSKFPEFDKTIKNLLFSK